VGSHGLGDLNMTNKTSKLPFLNIYIYIYISPKLWWRLQGNASLDYNFGKGVWCLALSLGTKIHEVEKWALYKVHKLHDLNDKDAFALGRGPPIKSTQIEKTKRWIGLGFRISNFWITFQTSKLKCKHGSIYHLGHRVHDILVHDMLHFAFIPCLLCWKDVHLYPLLCTFSA
jgi:hypothetical protein